MKPLFSTFFGFTIVGALATLTASADPPIGSGATCDDYLRTISRAAPPEVWRKGDINLAHHTLLQLRKAMVASHAAQEVREKAVDPGTYTESPALFDTGDGKIIRFHGGGPEQRNTPVSSEEYRTLKQRLDATIAKVEKTDVDDPDLAFFYLNDAHAIEKLLTTSKRIEDPERLRRRLSESGELCAYFGAAGGSILGLISSLSRPYNEKAIQKALDSAKATTVFDREKHLALIKLYLGDTERTKEVLAEHGKWLDELEKLGVPIRYGARFSDYQELERSHRTELLNELAQKSRRINSTILTVEERNHPTEGKTERDYKETFDSYEIQTYQNERTSLGVKFSLVVAESIAAAGLGGLVGYLACGKVGGKLMANRRESRRGAPTLRPPQGVEEFLTFVKQSKVGLPADMSGGPEEVLWYGANTPDGQHADFIMRLNRTVSPPTVQMAGLSYKMPVNYYVSRTEQELKALAAAAAGKTRLGVLKSTMPDPRTVNVADYKKHFIAERFPKLFGEEELKPISSVFLRAGRMHLSQAEMTTFLAELDKVSHVGQMRNVELLLKDLQEARERE